MLPSRDALTVCFAHVAYALQQQMDLRRTGIRSFEVRTKDELDRRIKDADVLVVSGLWHDGLADLAPKLKFIQSIGAGTDRFSTTLLKQRGIRLASAQGVNERAVAEHAIALILALARRLPEARDNQHRRHFRGMIGEIPRREDELGGKTLLIVGLGGIGGRLARLGKAFDLKVIGIRRDPARGPNGADSTHGLDQLAALLPQADIVALTCPLTAETKGIMNARTFGAMKPGAMFINVARGGCVDEPAMIEALRQGRIAEAGLDVFVDEPLPAESPLWAMDNVLITPHTAGETRRYEDNVLDIMLENLERLWRGETKLKNQVV
jgi:phosphoglycerate dehydrogenase-like enzyme